MQVFWRDGFRGASMSELTAAMGINKPSLYAAFGGKEQLYLKALEHYGATHGLGQAAMLDGDAPLRDALSNFLKVAVARGCSKDAPGGCYVVNALSDCGSEGTPEAVASATQSAFRLGQEALKARLARARRDCELPADADINALANLFMAVMTGIATMSRSGSSKAALNAVVDQALQALPPVSRKSAAR